MDDKEKYVKGFNHGYALREHEPELAKTLEKQFDKIGETPYGKGFKDGSHTMNQELKKQFIAKEKSQVPKSPDSPGRSIEPER